MCRGGGAGADAANHAQHRKTSDHDSGGGGAVGVESHTAVGGGAGSDL